MVTDGMFIGCRISIACDFKKLEETFCRQFGQFIKYLVNVPTRDGGFSNLDLIVTNPGKFYKPVIECPPFGLSDHDTIYFEP